MTLKTTIDKPEPIASILLLQQQQKLTLSMLDLRRQNAEQSKEEPAFFISY
jgi:hypothetical protein